ncbi:MAG: LysM peptidoglycan-binding domain-containing protein [Chitinophagaceae bacterium]
MHLRFVMIVCLGLFTHLLPAQQGGLAIKGISPDLHLLHTVAPKENWYSLGRMYNVSPKEISPYNGVSIDKPLSIGQQVKIPLTSANFFQNTTTTDVEVLIPLYHTVQDKEWMFRISTNYNKVPIEMLEKWNNISKDQAKAGMRLIVGYLKVKKDQSVLASNGAAVSSQPTSTIHIDNEPAAKTEEKKQEPVTRQAGNEEKQVMPAEEKKVTENRPVVTAAAGNNVEGGYFRSLFEESSRSASGSSGIFKSTSGWQDGKFYALMNNVAVGVIIKITNPSTNKEIYAKVLGQIPEMKESAGLTVRISDAAAAALGVNTEKFAVDIRY